MRGILITSRLHDAADLLHLMGVPRYLLIPAAALWAVLWLLVSFMEIPSYLHDPARPIWQPLSILASALVVAIGFIGCWLKLGSFPRIALDRPASWLIRSVALAPAYVIGIMGLTYCLRELIFSLAGSRYQLTASDEHPGFQITKIFIFYALWLGLAFGARMFMAWQDRRSLLSRTEAELDDVRRTLEKRSVGPAGLSRLPVPVGDRTRLIETASIAWIEADDNYVRIHTDGQDYAIRRSLQDLLDDLGGDTFVRIHKSAAINLADVRTVQSLGRGDAEVVLRNGVRLRVSRRYKDNLRPKIAT